MFIFKTVCTKSLVSFQHINDLSFAIDLEDTLKKAEGIYLQLKAMSQLPDSIIELLGFAITDTDGATASNSSTAENTPRYATPNVSTPSTPEKLVAAANTNNVVTSQKDVMHGDNPTTAPVAQKRRKSPT